MRSISALLEMAFNSSLMMQKELEMFIGRAFYDVLVKIKGEMKTFYEKWATNGTLSLAELTKYRRYARIEKKLIDMLNPIIKKNISSIKLLLPLQYKDAFIRTAWALDNAIGTHISLNLPEMSVIKNMFSVFNIENKFFDEALKNYPLEARMKIRQALFNGLQ